MKTELDAFILAGLEARQLPPAPAADKRTLLRRATFDLTGLPPTIAEINDFLADDSSDAFAKVVDRLLASPQYGERWGRHWLDIARYADSNGLDENLSYANAYLYRDYVVSAFNRDKPYDLFVQEQLAGDLLPPDSNPAVSFERWTATGFLSLGAKMLAEDDPVKMQMDIIDEQVDTIGRALMGMTLGCARCHDHKFDPVPTDDYYSLAGIFKSTKTMENFKVVAKWQERVLATPEEIQFQLAQTDKVKHQKEEIKRIVEETNAVAFHNARQHVAENLLMGTELWQLNEQLKQAKSMASDLSTANIRGLQIVEAEDFARGSAYKDLTNYGAGIGVIASPGNQLSFVEYDVVAETSGLHRLELRYAAAESRPVRLIINGEQVKAVAADKVTGTWFPDSQAWFVEGLFQLNAGQNVVRLERADPLPHFDKLLIVPVRFSESPLAAGKYEPHPVIVSQWARYLEKTKADHASALAVWHARLAAPGGAPAQKPPAPKIAVLFQDVPAVSREELATRYQELFDRAERAWKEFKSTDAGKDAKALPDAGVEAFRQVLEDGEGPFATPKSAETFYPADTVVELKRLREELTSLEKSVPQFREAMSVTDAQAENLKVHLRGSHLTLGKEVPRRFLRIMAGEDQTPIDGTRSGRLELAQWLTSPEHPLTSRVIVNRVWQGHFGEGLVRSPDNFGRLGERPTHPELLDWLARRLIEGGWSLKGLHRLIMLSSTYQMSTAYNADAALADPTNQLWWRRNRRRLEAEAIRDAVLAVSGSLDLTMGGTLLPTPNRQYVTGTTSVNPVLYEGTRRSIYLPVVRSALFDVFQAFDFADPSVLNGKRETTTVAPQALFMMNSKLVLQETKKLAAALLADPQRDDAERVRQMYEKGYGRLPTALEIERALAYVGRYTEHAEAKSTTPAESRLQAWQSLCRALLAANEFVYIE